MATVVGSGWTNPHNHLKRCYGEDNLKMFYEEAVAKKKEGAPNILGLLGTMVTANPREKAIIDWITLVVHKNLSLALVVSTRNPKLTSVWGSIWGSNDHITKWQFLNPQTAYEGPESHRWLTHNDANTSTSKK